ncbi:hypothetical protein U7537_04625 [Lacticaseibacillus rhamnosus]
MNNKKYCVSFCGESTTDPSDSYLQKRMVTIPEHTRRSLEGKPEFLLFVIDDGQEWFVLAQRIIEIVEVY